MRIAVACDHAAYEFKTEMIAFLSSVPGVEIIDVGCHSADRVDYPDFAVAACELVVKGECERAVLFCGSGIGISIAANKVSGIRCALCHDHYTAAMSRKHNNANAIAIGARVTGAEVAKEMLIVYLRTEFEGGRHADRIAKVHAIEASRSGSADTPANSVCSFTQ